MEVTIDQLQKGCIVEQDVMSLSNYPIIKKKTVIDSQHIELLKAFLITSIYIETHNSNGKVFQSETKYLNK